MGKDLTSEERGALSGVAKAVLQKNSGGLDDLVQQVRGALASKRGAASQ